MARPALTEEQRRQTRRRIQQAAAELYAESGFNDITARKIAGRAGVSVGSLYSYFDNLTELMQSLWKGPVRRLQKEMDAALAADEEPLARLRIFLERYAQFALTERATYRGAFMFVRPETQTKPDPVPLEQDPLFAALRGIILAGQDQGQIRDGDTNQIAQTIWSGIHGAVALPLSIDRLALSPPEQALPLMVETLLEWAQA